MRGFFKNRRQMVMLVTAVGFFGIVGGLYETTFNNYLSEVFKISDSGRGALEFPREMPGFLVTLVAGSLAALALNRVGFVAMLAAGAGLAGMAFAGGHFGVMGIFMVLFSTGAHLNMPTQQSIALAVAKKGSQATTLGKIGAAGILGTVLGAGFVALAMRRDWVSFKGVYLIAAWCAVVGGLFILRMGNVERGEKARRKVFVFKRRYALYYALCALFGARKQVFMTFGPWVLIRIFDQKTERIADLWLIYSIFGLAVRPLVGKLIDLWGERRILVSEGILLVGVCITYAVGGQMPDSAVALVAVMAAYVVDQLCFSMTIARTTYLSKILENPEDLSGGLSAGISIDHMVSMVMPIFGGMVWARFGFQWVFIAAAVIAATSSVLSLAVRVPAASDGEGEKGPAEGGPR